MHKVYANAGLGYISPTMTTPAHPEKPGRCGYHDIGGLTAGEIDPAEEPIEFWHKQNEAIRGLLGDPLRRMVSVDEVRRAFESFGEDKYNRLSFYERRIEALLDVLVEKGLIDRDTFLRRVEAELAARAAVAPAGRE